MANSPLKFIGAALGVAATVGMGLYKKHQAKKETEALEQQEVQQQEMLGLAEEQNASMQEYETDVNLAAQSLSSPTTMKSLSSVGMSYSPLKMKAKEANRAATMMKISGADTMPERSSLTYKKY